jgi:predicted GIY-YIG superfamily endonuclease
MDEKVLTRLIKSHAMEQEVKQRRLVQLLYLQITELRKELHEESERYTAMRAIREDGYRVYGDGPMSLGELYELNIEKHIEAGTGVLGFDVVKQLTTSAVETHSPDKYVYLISSGDGTVKIGVSVDAEKRLSALQSSNPNELSIIGKVKSNNAYDVEHEIHHKHKDKRARGEWFKLSNEDIETIFSEYNFTRIDT